MIFGASIALKQIFRGCVWLVGCFVHPAFYFFNNSITGKGTDMSCGFLERNQEGFISGQYKLWGKPALPFKFAENAKATEKAPDYLIMATDPCGDTVQIGVAYRNTIKEGAKSGLDCFSLFFQEPALFKQPLKLGAFPSMNDGSRFVLEYEQERAENKAA